MLLVFVSLTSLAQIPNNDFEVWSPAGGYQSPDDWDNLNQITDNNGIYTCIKGSPGYTGASYLYLMTKVVPGKGIVPGIAVCGKLDTLTYKAKSGFSYSTRPQELSYYMQYMPYDPSDSSSVKVFLTKWNVSFSKRDTIAYGATYFNGMAHTWVYRTTLLNYYSGDNPDSAMIIISSSDNTPSEFSYIYIDNLQFNGSVAGIDPLFTDLNLSVFPNPASDFVTIEYEGKVNTECELMIFDSFGKIVFKSTFTDHKKINLPGWHKGIYFVQMKDRNHTLNRKLIIH